MLRHGVPLWTERCYPRCILPRGVYVLRLFAAGTGRELIFFRSSTLTADIPPVRPVLQTIWIQPSQGATPYQVYCGDNGMTLAMLIKCVVLSLSKVCCVRLVPPSLLEQRCLPDLPLHVLVLDNGLVERPGDRPGPVAVRGLHSGLRDWERAFGGALSAV